jgi:anti-anti-sigma factor
MSINVQKHLIIEEQGEITIAKFIDEKILEDVEVEIIGKELCELIEHDGCRKLIVDFAPVRFMASAMLGKLIVLQSKMNTVQGNLRLCNVCSEIYEVFRITKTYKMFSMHKQLDKALAGI